MNEHDARKSERTRCSRLVRIGAKHSCPSEDIARAIEDGLTPQEFEERTEPGAKARIAQEEKARCQQINLIGQRSNISPEDIAAAIEEDLTVQQFAEKISSGEIRERWGNRS